MPRMVTINPTSYDGNYASIADVCEAGVRISLVVPQRFVKARRKSSSEDSVLA